jgi:hypothetical protein
MPTLSATVCSRSDWPRKNAISYHGECIIRSDNDCVVVMTDSEYHKVNDPRATLREVIKAYWDDSAPLLTYVARGSDSPVRAQELLDVAVADFPDADREYDIELGGGAEGAIRVQLASNYRGFICDVDILMEGGAVKVSTDTSNFVFSGGATLREIAKTCWHESKPLLFRDEMPAPVPVQELLDIPVADLPRHSELTLEIYEKGNILYSD